MTQYTKWVVAANSVIFTLLGVWYLDEAHPTIPVIGAAFLASCNVMIFLFESRGG
jgi:hypothetical protein